MESGDCLNLEMAIARWRASSALDADALAELEAHLRDAYAAEVAGGLPPGRAFSAACARLGDAAQITDEFSKLQDPKSNTMNLTILTQSPRLRRLAWQLAIVLFIAIPLRVFAVAPYRAVGASVAPEIPAGSHLLVWRIAPSFAVGDIAAYHHGPHIYLGRVTAVSVGELTLSRAGQAEQAVPRSAVVGRVVVATR